MGKRISLGNSSEGCGGRILGLGIIGLLATGCGIMCIRPAGLARIFNYFHKQF